MHKVSVVIASYNYGRYLGEALRSVLEQSYVNFEIIVIDDGSIDNTPDVMKQYLGDLRVKYIRQDNQGHSKARNRGIAVSTGEFIAFLDADDVWFPSKLERQIPLFEDPDVGVVYSRRMWIDQDGKEFSGNERVLRRGNILNYIFVDNFICFSSSVVRRSLLGDAGCFDESLSMGNDFDLWIRLAARCKFNFVDEPLVKYRSGHANLSQNTMRRYEYAQRIMNKALRTPEIRSKFSWYVPRLAWADTWSNMATYLMMQGKHTEAWQCLWKALLVLPVYPQLWKRMIRCIVRW